MTILIPKFQIGKNKLNRNFLTTLENSFKKHRNIKISVLKSGLDGDDKKKIVKGYSDKILKHLGKTYTSRVIGHTIVLKKWRKAPKN